VGAAGSNGKAVGKRGVQGELRQKPKDKKHYIKKKSVLVEKKKKNEPKKGR